ncbi:MAG: hypothetical protein SOX70_06050 [Peptoniphilaceae bacterium]|nr:hypothetical protein [Peptoniphilaceae bacterium]
MLYQTSPAFAQDVSRCALLPEDSILVVERDRGVLDDLCRSGKKQYCVKRKSMNDQ